MGFLLSPRRTPGVQSIRPSKTGSEDSRRLSHKMKSTYIDDIVLKDAENHFTVDGLKETLMPDLVLLQELKVRLSLKFLILSKSVLLNSLCRTIPGAFCHSGRRWHVPVYIQQLHSLWGSSQNLIRKETICAFGRCGYEKIYACRKVAVIGFDTCGTNPGKRLEGSRRESSYLVVVPSQNRNPFKIKEPCPLGSKLSGRSGPGKPWQQGY